MKSLAELEKLRDITKKKIELRDGDCDYRIVVGMATCGIAAGARPVLNALIAEATEAEYSCTIAQTGCIGMCTLEPLVEVFDKNGNKTTYVLINPEKAVEIMREHIGKGNIVEKYTVGSVKR
ncbi:MAG: (2Fe-2S) ferredoxin domain-containing protein [Erysipelotrichaceae bacterium]|nr:(2Fe-2S) ferredoxin domain-containing protein [Erysipelotrichaceae bacterium]MDD3923858.1 (2Fe-2S) ferredoxin domain-containing protein [Erysipelotrichaceae bacterium]MDD4641910.1 (2Fe-2S) ferredoxin domain-containing protein [Erysipelotrichaceae bacterium]